MGAIIGVQQMTGRLNSAGFVSLYARPSLKALLGTGNGVGGNRVSFRELTVCRDFQWLGG